jgi:transposase-like protein
LPKHKGKKINGNRIRKQNYLCKKCGRQLIGDYALCYNKIPFVADTKDITYDCSRYIRDIAAIEKISIKKALSTPVYSRLLIQHEKIIGFVLENIS